METATTSQRAEARLIGGVALLVFALDQFTKYLVLHFLGKGEERVIIDGFFKFVHWGNTGAAWSMFRGNNALLAIIALIALLVLVFSRHHFNLHLRLGQVAFGLLVGGIMGNVTDRLLPSRLEVIDFIYFYLHTARGEIGFPAFNIADSAICTGVGIIFLLTWQSEHRKSEETKEQSANNAEQQP